MIFAAADPSALSTVVLALLGGGGIGGIVAYRRAGSEADNIAARTLIAVNDELRKELKRVRDEAQAQLTIRDREIASLRERVAVLESNNPGGTT